MSREAAGKQANSSRWWGSSCPGAACPGGLSLSYTLEGLQVSRCQRFASRFEGVWSAFGFFLSTSVVYDFSMILFKRHLDLSFL